MHTELLVKVKFQIWHNGIFLELPGPCATPGAVLCHGSPAVISLWDFIQLILIRYHCCRVNTFWGNYVLILHVFCYCLRYMNLILLLRCLFLFFKDIAFKCVCVCVCMCVYACMQTWNVGVSVGVCGGQNWSYSPAISGITPGTGVIALRSFWHR